MNVAEITKNFNAGGAITKRRLIKFGTDERTVVQAAAASDAIIGVSTDVSTDSGETVDVYIADGIVPIEAGGAVTLGAFVTADANGKAVAAATGNRVAGFAMQAAAADGDLIEIVLAPGFHP